MLWCPLRFPHGSDVLFVFASSCLWGVSCLVGVICVCLRVMVSSGYCVVFLFCFSLSCCQFLCIVHLWLSLRHSLAFVYLLKPTQLFNYGPVLIDCVAVALVWKFVLWSKICWLWLFNNFENRQNGLYYHHVFIQLNEIYNDISIKFKNKCHYKKFLVDLKTSKTGKACCHFMKFI